MAPRADSLKSAFFRGHRLVRRQVAAMRKTVEPPPDGGRTEAGGSRTARRAAVPAGPRLPEAA